MCETERTPPDDTTPPATAEGSYEWWRTEVAARDAELAQARLELKRERVILKRAERHAMRCDADQAAAEAGQARAEARYAGLNAHHLRAVADHRADLDAMVERAERAEAAIEGRTAAPRPVLIRALQEALPYIEGWTAELTTNQAGAVIDALLAVPESNADALTAVSTPTEAHGETGEAQEGSQ